MYIAIYQPLCAFKVYINNVAELLMQLESWIINLYACGYILCVTDIRIATYMHKYVSCKTINLN